MPLDNGDLLNNRYRIIDTLGQGGMGAVYRAVDENLDVVVAVKENFFYSEDYARQFEREARVLANLRHPNLPRVFDYFVIDQQGQYLVMDFIEGDDLRQWMSHEAHITEQEVLQIGVAICDALVYLHSRIPAIVHRDIKPGNVKITPNGDVVLVDFGLVKVLSDQQITTTAARAMTPGYSPPEQYGSGPTDHRSDIFSLGATLYAALTGYLPEDSLARTTGKATLTPLRDHDAGISKATADAIEKALSLRFEDRWQSAKEFQEALARALAALPLEAPGSSRLAFSEARVSDAAGRVPKVSRRPAWLQRLAPQTSHRKWYLDPVWIVFAVVTLVLIVLMIVSLANPGGFQPFFQENPEAIAGASRTPDALGLEGTQAPGMANPTDSGAEESSEQSLTPQPTPRGGGFGMFAFTSERSGQPQIWLFDIRSRQATQLTDLMDGACQPDWSPDGERLVFTSPCPKNRSRYPGASLMLLDLASEEVSLLVDSLEGDFDPAWSPDGNWVAYTSLINGQMQLMKINTNTGAVVRLSDGGYDDSEPVWSPDGRRLAFIRTRSVGQVWLMDADGENPLQFSLSGAIDNSDPEWFEREDLILYSQALGLGSPSKQLFGMRLEDAGKAEEYVLIPTSESDYIPLMDHVAVSPDGYWLAFDYWYFDVLSDIYVMAFPGSNLVQMTEDPAMDYGAVWRP